MKMSKDKFDSDGFQIVNSKRFSKKKPTKIPSKDKGLEKEETLIDTVKAIRRIYSAVEELQDSKYLQDLSKSVSTVIQSRTVVEFVCFGLGHIGECHISKYQVALLLCLKDLCSPKKVFVHDPVFYKSECAILKQLGLEIIEQNTEGSYITSETGVTLFYFPHCPKQLTNNFFWSNWGPNLQNCILISNSVSSLIENQLNRILSETVPYIYKIAPYSSEVAIENNFRYTDIFNDTSLHYFSKEKLDKVNLNFWIKGDKPSYKDTEEFISSLMIEKLNI